MLCSAVKSLKQSSLCVCDDECCNVLHVARLREKKQEDLQKRC